MILFLQAKIWTYEFLDGVIKLNLIPNKQQFGSQSWNKRLQVEVSCQTKYIVSRIMRCVPHDNHMMLPETKWMQNATDGQMESISVAVLSPFKQLIFEHMITVEQHNR